ncbi:MAG: plastocyanin/azurin family copper-binding protein, partial [Halorhabdus sp.]
TATDTETTTKSPTATPTATNAAADKTIVMESTTFQTLKAEVATGATVKWTNKDGFAHTVTSAQFHDVAKSWSLDKEVSGGGSVTHTFDEKGVYEYYCTIHGKSTMCGAVLVGGATLDKSLPCGGDGGDDGGGGYY